MISWVLLWSMNWSFAGKKLKNVECVCKTCKFSYKYALYFHICEVTWAIMDMSRVDAPKVMAVPLTIESWNLFISARFFSKTPFRFSQWIFIRIFLSEILTSISGRGSSTGMPAAWLSEDVLLAKATDSVDFSEFAPQGPSLFLEVVSSTW